MKKIVVQSILLVSCIYTNAQQAFKNNGNFQIHPGASVTGFGDFTNASSAVLLNNGDLYIKQTLTNDQSSMTAGTGTFYLNGTSGQSVNGSQAFKTYNLNTNNSAGFTLNNNLSVSGTHTFAAGIIVTSATPNYLVYEAGSSYSGSGDSKHVNGWVKKFGSTNFTFPVGDATYERSVALSSLSASSEFNAKYLTNTPNITLYDMQLPLRSLDPMEYWSVQKISGGSARVTMNWNYSKVYFPYWIVPDIIAAGYIGSYWTDNGGAGTATGNVTTTGTVTSNSISSFNLFTFGSISWALSLKLIAFTAHRQDNYTKIEWITEKEYNTDHFIVERSDNGTYFYTIAQLPGRNSGITEQYYSRDDASINNIAYYRLRTIDADGKATLSRVVSVTDISTKGLTLFTNPVSNKVTLLATGQLNGKFYYQISMINGQLVQQDGLVIQTGGLYEIPLNGKLQPGIYILHVTDVKQSFNYKLMVQ